MEKSHTQTRWWDWPAVLLLFILLQTLASRLVATSWTPNLHLIQSFTSMGIIIGLALGYSLFQRRTARWINLLYLLLMLPLQWTLVIDKEVSLEEKLSSVAGRLIHSFSEFFARKPVEDPLFFVAIMSVLFWIISASAAFQLTRSQNFLAIVLPSAIGILVIQGYDNGIAGRLIFLAFFIFIALCLLGRLNFLQDQKLWREKRVFLSPENTVDLTGGMAIAAGLIILTAWTVPLSFSRIDTARQAWNRITKPWNDFTHRMENAVSALKSSSGGGSSEFYGPELQLGTGFALSDALMFQVQTPDLAPDQVPPRYYWRGRVYDYFVKGQWYTTGTTRQKFSPVNGNPSVADANDGTPARFIFSASESKLSLLYAPSQPVWFSRPGSFLGAPADKEQDIFSWNASPLLLPGETYQVDAVIKNPNMQQLRDAGNDYPEWVAKKYLQLPQNFSPRIKTLARDITTDADNPYDQAVAVTNYLRKTIKYASTVPQPPRNEDTLEWLLFDYKQGYCVYYATSEVLMLRSLGIPARMAVGFSQGTVVNKTGISRIELEEATAKTYSVLKKNAHAWPEVYFPGIGWVEFEPTGNQDPLTRPLPLGADNNNGGLRVPPAAQEDSGINRNNIPKEDQVDPNAIGQRTLPLSPLLYLIPLLLAFATLTMILNRRYSLAERAPLFVRVAIERFGMETPDWVVRWEQWVSLSSIQKAFESINFALRQLDDKPVPVHATPAERAEKLSQILPHMAGQIKALLDEHQTSLYTSQVANPAEARSSAFRIRMEVLVALIRHFFTDSYVPNS